MLGRTGGTLVLLWLIACIGYVGGAWGPLLLAIATIAFLVSFLMQLDPETSWV